MSEKFVVIAADKISLSGLVPLTEDDRFEVLVPDGWSPEEMQEALGRAHGLIVRSATKVTRELLEQAPNLKVIGRAGVGVDNIDLEVATELGIPVINAPEGNTVSAAELAMALILTVARNVSWADASVRSGAWARSKFSGIEIRGKVLGLIGAGRIGTEVALRAQAFGMEAIAWSENLTNERAAEHGAVRVEKDELFGRSDVLTIHLLLSERTRGLVGARELELMKPTAYLVNTSRGPIVDETALIEVLEKGRISGAGIDVYDTEPLPVDHPLRGLDNTVLTGHTGYVVSELYELVYGEAIEGINVWLAGTPVRVLNA